MSWTAPLSPHGLCSWINPSLFCTSVSQCAGPHPSAYTHAIASSNLKQANLAHVPLQPPPCFLRERAVAACCFLLSLETTSSGFRSQHYSCQDLSNLHVATSSGQVPVLILLGFSTAYDTIDCLSPSEPFLWYLGHHMLFIFSLPLWSLFSQSPLLDPPPHLPDLIGRHPPGFFSIYILRG